MMSLWLDARLAIRQLTNSPGFTTISILTLALGIGANTALFTLVHAILLGQLPFQEPGRVLSLENGYAAGIGNSVGSKDSVFAFNSGAQAVQTIEAAAIYSASGVNVDVPSGAAVRGTATETSALFLRVLGVTPELGRGFVTHEDVPGADHVVLISDRFWHGELHSSPGVLGSKLVINGFDFRIVGVLPRKMNFPVNSDFWTPTIFDEHTALREAGAFLPSVVVRTRPNASIHAVQSELMARAMALAGGKVSRERSPSVTPIAAELTRSIRSSLLMLTGAVLLVLLIACANLACLILVRVERRRSDLAVRIALGAGRGRIIQKQLVECLLLSIAGGAAGVALAYGALQGLLVLRPAALTTFQQPTLDLTALMYTAFASLATGLAFGLAPALHASREDPVNALKTGMGRASLRASRLRKTLVIGESAVALVLLTGALLLTRTVANLDRVPLGYSVQGLLTFSVSLHGAPYNSTSESNAPALVNFYNQTLQRLQAIPGVISAGSVSKLPLDTGPDMLLTVSTTKSERGVIFAAPRVASSGYFAAMGIPVVAGRDFSPRDTRSSAKVAIVSRDLAQMLWPGQNPVGRSLQCEWFCTPEALVIGVVATTRQYGPRGEMVPEYFLTYPQQDWPDMTFVLRTAAAPQGLIAVVRHAVAEVDPTQPVYDTYTMQQRLDGNESLVRFEMFVLTMFAGLAIALVGIGLYGIVAYSVAGRTHEIGVRLALGAQRGAIVGEVFREGVLLALAGAAAGLGCSLVLMRVLAATLFGVTASDPLTLGSACALVLAVGASASLLPARRAALVEPMAALRGR